MDPEPQTFNEFRMILGLESEGKLDENTSDWEAIEDTSNSFETFGIDTPSETDKSDSSSIPVSTDYVSVDRTEYSRASARDAIDTASFSDGAASSLDNSVQHFARQDTPGSHTESQRCPAFARRNQTAKSTDPASTIIQQPKPPKSTPENPIETLAMRLKQPPKSGPLKDSHKPRSKIASGHQSILTSYMFEKAKQQPTDVIVLYIVKGIGYEERMLVRMYRTTPFVLLKNELRDKDDTVSELAIKDAGGGEFPVFDNDSPLSYLNTGRAAHDLEWMMSSILKPSWSWTEDMLKRAGKQTVEWLDELWIVEGTSKHEVSADAKADGWADLEDTDDNWSMCVDTPSETESNATSRLTNTVPTDRKKSRRVSLSDTVDTTANQEAVASYAKALNQLLVPQDRSKRYVQQQAKPGVSTKHRRTVDLRDPSNITTQQLEPSKPESLNQTSKHTLQQPLQEHTLETWNTPSSKKARLNHKQLPMPTSSSSKQRAEHQPAGIIVVEDTHDLAIIDDDGDFYPVFDNDTPSSVGLQHWAILFWVPTQIVPKSLDLTEEIEMGHGHSRRKTSDNARRY
ncbi:hypothetical protein KCU73_g8782, partial [Aureobasidium melanogenum]